MRHQLPLIFLLTGCQTQPDLTGHWHAETIRDDNNGTYRTSHHTFDIYNDNTVVAYHNPPFWHGHGGTIDQEAKTIDWGVECISTDWRYEEKSSNKLAVYDRNNHRANRIRLVRKNNCTVESHLFMSSRLEIRLPDSKPEAIPLVEKSLNRQILIGPAIPEYKKFYPASFNYQLGDKIIRANDTASLLLFEEQHHVKLPEAKRHLTKAVIFANAKTPANSLNNILTYTCGRSNEMLYFATLQRSPDNTILWYQPVEVRSATAPPSRHIQS